MCLLLSKQHNSSDDGCTFLSVNYPSNWIWEFGILSLFVFFVGYCCSKASSSWSLQFWFCFCIVHASHLRPRAVRHLYSRTHQFSLRVESLKPLTVSSSAEKNASLCCCLENLSGDVIGAEYAVGGKFARMDDWNKQKFVRYMWRSKMDCNKQRSSILANIMSFCFRKDW